MNLLPTSARARARASARASARTSARGGGDIKTF